MLEYQRKFAGERYENEVRSWLNVGPFRIGILDGLSTAGKRRIHEP